MKWEGNRESDNVEDRRDEGGGGGQDAPEGGQQGERSVVPGVDVGLSGRREQGSHDRLIITRT